MNEIINQITQAPSLEHPAALTGAALGPALSYVGYRFQQIREGRKPAADITNIAGLTAAVNTAPNSRLGGGIRRRIALGIGALASYSLVAAGPMAEQIIPNEDANNYVVYDGNYSMLHTHDMGDGGASRDEAMRAALRKSIADTPSNLNISIVGFGARPEVVQAATNNHDTLTKRLESPLVADPNGGAANDALKLVVDTMPEQRTESTKSVLIISDGIINDQPALMETIKDATKRGINITAVVPGHKDTIYQLRPYSEKVPSGIKPEVFAAAGKGNVRVVTNEAAAVKEFQQVLTETAQTRQNKPWQPARWLAAGLSMLTVATFLKENVKDLALVNRTKPRKVK